MSVNIEKIIEELGLDRLLDDTEFHWDLREGVVFSEAKTRVCLFSSDLLSGVYKAIFEEAGEAWPLIFKTCGQLWGAKLARRLDQEFLTLFQQKPEDLSVQHYCEMITAYFAAHGWGVVTLHLEKAQESGLVEIQVKNSIFSEVVDDTEEMVDPMLAGIFASLFSHLAQQELDCVQTSCESKGAECSRFLLSAPARLSDVASEVRGGSSHEQVLARL